MSPAEPRRDRLTMGRELESTGRRAEGPGDLDAGGRWPPSRWLRAARGLAALAFVVSLISGAYLATAGSWGTSSGGQVIAGGGTTSSTTWSDRPERNPDNERVMKVWAAVVVTLAFVGLVAAWSGPRWLSALPAVLLSVHFDPGAVFDRALRSAGRCSERFVSTVFVRRLVRNAPSRSSGMMGAGLAPRGSHRDVANLRPPARHMSCTP